MVKSMIDFSKPVQTKRGHSVEILSTNTGDPMNPVAGILSLNCGKRLAGWKSDGTHRKMRITGSDAWNLQNVPPPPPPEVVRFSKLSGDPEAGGVKLGLWRKKAPKLGPQDTGILKLTCVDGKPVSAEIIAA